MNIFSVLDSSDAEEEVVKTGNKTATQKAPAATGNDNKQAAAKPKAQPAKPVVQKTVPGMPPKATKDVKEKEEPKPAAPTANANDNEPREKKDDNRGGRPRGKEQIKRGDKHHNVDGEKPRRPKREFERHSGTGRGREVSRGGRGPYGFGNVEQEAQEAEKDPAKAEAEDKPENADDAAEPEPESTEVVEPEPEEPAALSYEDFMKQRQEARANSSVLSAARSQRTVLETQFAGLTTKQREDEEEENKAKSANSKKDQRSTSKAQVLDVAFKFENHSDARERGPFGGRRNNREGDREGGREGRGGRGRGRGEGRGEGRGHEGRSDRPRRQNPAATLNTNDFPSL